MNVPAKYNSLATLYPLNRDNSCRAIIQAVQGWTKTLNGKPSLLRELSVAERTLLQDRLHRLNENLQSAKHHEIIQRVSQMILGFGAAGAKIEAKDAKTIAAQYAFVLQALPMWAVERAVGKFERGEITIEQIEGVNRAFWPTTAQLHAIAESLCGEFYAEQRQVHDALHGVFEREPSPEERERVKAGLNELAANMKGMRESEEADRRAKVAPFQSLTDEALRAIYTKGGQGTPLQAKANQGQDQAKRHGKSRKVA